MRKISALALFLFSALALAGPSVKVAVNYDNTVDTTYRAGDKPVAGAACPTGWTCDATGDATEDIDEVSATSFLMVVSGTSDATDIGRAYKTTATADDIEIIARIPATWSGHLENSTQFGVGVEDDTGYHSQAYWRNLGDGMRCRTDVNGAGQTTQVGLANQSTPRYIAYQYEASETAERCFESSDGVVWTQIGADVTKSLTFPVLGYVYGTSHIATATTTATLTGISHSNTLTINIGGGGGGGANVAPVWNATPVVNCTAGETKVVSLANSANTSDAGEYLSDENADALALTSQGTALPSGVAFDLVNYDIVCSTGTSEGTTAGVVIGADDGTAARVDSSEFSIVIGAAGGGEEDATLLWESGFEAGAADITGSGSATWKSATNGQGELSAVQSGTGGCSSPRAGSWMGKAEIPSGASGTPQRAEFRERPSESFEWDGSTYWVGGSICFDSFTGSVNTLVQIHASNEGPGECDMAGNGFGIHGSGTWEVIDNAEGSSEGGGANSNHITVYTSNFTQAANQDTWHDFVVKIKANTDHSGVEGNCNGEYSLWHNGVLVASDTGACNVNYKDECGTVIQPPKNKWTGLSTGLYQGNTTARVMYLDAFRIAVGENGFNTVDPAQDD